MESEHDPHAQDVALDLMYTAGWNSALEMLAYKITYDFSGKLEKDTLASFAVWIKELKR